MRKLAFRYRRVKELYNTYKNNIGGEFNYQIEFSYHADQSKLHGDELPLREGAWEATEGMESDVTEPMAVESY